MTTSELTIYSGENIAADCVTLTGDVPAPDDWLLRIWPAGEGASYEAGHRVNVWGTPEHHRKFLGVLVLAYQAVGILPENAAALILGALDGTDLRDGVDPETIALRHAMRSTGARADA